MEKENVVSKSVTDQGFTVTTNPGSLKAKLNKVENILRQLDDEIAVHQKEVTVLRAEKDNLQTVLNAKTNNVKDSIANELEKIEQDMKKHFSHQKAENSRL
jgi:hypothetical protein